MAPVFRAVPWQEVAGRDAAAFLGRETAHIACLEARPEHVRIAPLRFQHDAVLVRFRIIKVPSADAGMIPGFRDLAQGHPGAGGQYARLRGLNAGVPFGDAFVAPLVVLAPYGTGMALPVFARNFCWQTVQWHCGVCHRENWAAFAHRPSKA